MSNWEKVYAAGQQLNRYPYPEVVSFVKRLGREREVSELTALDVGCGSGVHAFFLAEEGARVLAFDGSVSAIHHAKKIHPHERIDYSVAALSAFSAGDTRYDIVVDRLSSTCASEGEVADFYQRLRAHLAPGARVFWQGFDYENSGRLLGRFDPDVKAWTDFSSGIFAEKDLITFFREADIEAAFAGYSFRSKRIMSDTDLLTGHRHSYWSLELEV